MAGASKLGLAFVGGGKFIVSGSESRDCFLYDLEKGGVKRIEGHSGVVRGVVSSSED